MNTQVNDPKGAAGALKVPLHLVPPYALEQTAWVHKLGSEKYGPYNWRKTGVCASTYVSAIMRHLNAWRDGEDLDPESGISHIAHIATSCNILLDAAHCGTLQDDRNKKPPVPEAEAIKDEPVVPDKLPAFPPVPEGYSRWMYRGKGLKSDRRIRFASYGRFDADWVTFPFGCTVGYKSTHYIEAVKL
jgi:hypothetical protein